MVPDIDGPTHAYLGAPAGCWAIYCQVLAKDYSDAGYFASHQLVVDTYSVQHPGTPERRTIQSLAVHLITLGLAMESDLSPSRMPHIRKRTVERGGYHWLEPPGSNYDVTILDIAAAEDVADRTERVSAWANHVWAFWTPHHETIRAWTDEVLSS